MDLRASVRSDFRQRFESSRDRESNSSWAVQRSEGHPLTGQESSARRSRTDSMHETGKLPHDPQPQGLGPVHTLKPVAPSGRRNTREVPPTLPRFHVTTFHQSMIPSVVPSETVARLLLALSLPNTPHITALVHAPSTGKTHSPGPFVTKLLGEFHKSGH